MHSLPESPRRPVPRGAAITATVLLTVLAAVILHGFTTGESLLDALKAMAKDVWGRGTLLDLYVGFFLFAMWIVHREKSKVRAAAWIGATMCLGNLVTCAYLLWAVRSARGDGERFWHGES